MTSEKIERIKELMCDKYCRFPELPGTQFAMDAICKSCPLNELEVDE